jgi:hypothetical protein
LNCCRNCERRRHSNMNERFHLYQSDLRTRNISRYKLIGIVSEILLSTELFPRNEEISIFLNNVLNISYKEYVMKSRTTIVARCIRDIYIADEKVFETYRGVLLDYVKSDIEVKPPTKKKADTLHKWMGGINE